MEKKLDGQVILVTGAGRGLGASFCHVVAAAGAIVLALGRDATALNALLDSLPGSGHEMLIADVTDAAEVAAALAGKRCHAVVNNAGIAATAALHNSSVDEAKNIINTNLLGNLWVVQASVPALLAAGGGGHCQYCVCAGASSASANRGLCSQQGSGDPDDPGRGDRAGR